MSRCSGQTRCECSQLAVTCCSSFAAACPCFDEGQTKSFVAAGRDPGACPAVADGHGLPSSKVN